eukprot:2144428-Pyramimonas_sp.AAC.1
MNELRKDVAWSIAFAVLLEGPRNIGLLDPSSVSAQLAADGDGEQRRAVWAPKKPKKVDAAGAADEGDEGE